MYNVRQLKKIIGRTQLLAVVKANAYGHGMREVSTIIADHVDWFGVASLEESLALKKIIKAKRPILILSFVDLKENLLAEAIGSGISLPLYNLEQAKAYQKFSSLRKKAKVHLKIDTGTTRVGVRPEGIVSFLKKIEKFDRVQIEGVYSHFADSEENDVYTKLQLKRFVESVSLVKRKYGQLLTHISCSASSVLHPDSRFDLVRAGIMLYGLHPSKKTRISPDKNDYVGGHISLRPVLTWKTKLVSIKQVPPNCYVGYGLTYRTKRKTQIAVVPVGYADGFDRKLSNSGAVLIKGKKFPVVGRVCMNISMLDVADERLKVGDEVVIIGEQNKAKILPGDQAAKIGTINYEVVTRINWDTPRIIS